MNRRNTRLTDQRRPRTRPRRAFTLVELLIVVAIIGILAAMVLPRFSDASHTARQNTLKDDLRYLRTQIVVFKAQHHDTPPGYPDGNMAAPPDAETFKNQMTGTTDEHCRVGAPSPVFRFGPYLSRMPPNPLNGQSTVRVVFGGQNASPDGLTGWIYKPETLEIFPNLVGTDPDGTRYIDY